MTECSPSDTRALTATAPEHCLDCFRLIRPGETYYPGEDDTVLCPICVSNLLIGEDFDTIQATDQGAVDYGGGLIRVRRVEAAIIVAPDEVRYLVDALAKGATRLVDEQVGVTVRWLGPGRTFRSAASTRTSILTC